MPIDDLDDTSARIAIGEIYAVTFDSGRNGAVQALGRRAFGAGLLARQTEVADEHGLGRVAQIVDLRHARDTPPDDAGDEIS